MKSPMGCRILVLTDTHWEWQPGRCISAVLSVTQRLMVLALIADGDVWHEEGLWRGCRLAGSFLQHRQVGVQGESSCHLLSGWKRHRPGCSASWWHYQNVLRQVSSDCQHPDNIVIMYSGRSVLIVSILMTLSKCTQAGQSWLSVSKCTQAGQFWLSVSNCTKAGQFWLSASWWHCHNVLGQVSSDCHCPNDIVKMYSGRSVLIVSIPLILSECT